MPKSAKQLIDNLVDAVQDFDGRFARSSGNADTHDAAYLKARRELREALLSARATARVKKSRPRPYRHRQTNNVGND
jgi:hypothetical protein